LELQTGILAALVFAARLADVTLGTLRHVLVIRGYRAVACCVALVESMLWVFAITRVLSRIQEPVVAAAFALGFTAGTLAGMTLEQFLKLGEQVVRLFTTSGELVATRLRALGFRVTQFEGRGRDGSVELLFVQVPRKRASQIATIARQLDPHCFCVIDDVRAIEQAK
jgi:uncharacterized protein YebE (UPF0316 family)